MSLVLVALLAGVLAAQDRKEEPPADTRFVFDLADGSSVIGTPLFQILPLESTLGRVEMRMDRIQGIEFLDDHASIKVLLTNGDKLTGRSVTNKFEVQAIFGKVSLEIAQIKKSRRYRSLDQKLKDMLATTGKSPDQATLDNIRQIGLACKQYAVDHNDKFPDKFDQVWKDYLPKDSPAWHSPYDPDNKEPSYRLIPNLTEAGESETILIEETVVHDGQRAVYHIGGHVKMVPAKE